MRLPTHVVLDFENNEKQNNNWYSEFLLQRVKYPYIFSLFSINKKFFPKKYLGSKLITKQDKYTIQYSQFFKKSRLRKLNLTFTFGNTKKEHITTETLKNLVNVHFLRKERLYTKLKYSRSPAYDIVSGGAAALLAGFLGFLVSEKYGFELVDSGDFYYLFMYMVFLGFSLKPLLTSVDYNDSFKNIFSFKLFLNFYLTLIYYIFKRR